MSVAVLDAVQVLNQQIAPARIVLQQRTDLVARFRVDLAPFGVERTRARFACVCAVADARSFMLPIYFRARTQKLDTNQVPAAHRRKAVGRSEFPRGCREPSGIDTGEAGTTMSLQEAFPELPPLVGKTREARAAKAQ